MLREISQSQDKFCVILLVGSMESSQVHSGRKQMRGYQGLGNKRKEELFDDCRVSVREDEQVLDTDCTAV
jgi:hypothetical protein